MDLKVILENSIMQKGLPATAGSKMLVDFIAPVDATVVERLRDAGVSVVGRMATSEFGVGGLLTDGVKDYGVVDSVACGEADVALCNDYTGSISRAAAMKGLYYIHPTYGTVSRYGLIPAVMSMDQIGVVCRRPEDGFLIMEIISGRDTKDGVMAVGHGVERSTAGDAFSFPAQAKALSALADDCSRSHEIKKHPLPRCGLPYSEVLLHVMQILCCAEFSNNISRYDGVRYGFRAEGYNGLEELYKKSRTEAFGEDIKLAAIVGAMVLSQENYLRFYDKAMRMRRLIRDSLEFDKYDVITNDKGTGLLRALAMTEDGGEVEGASLLLISRLCGLPSLTTPEHVYIADAGCEDVLRAVSCGGACDESGAL